jgi:hypothetical protein
MKRDALDAVFSDLVRERDDWSCRRCGTHFPDRKGRDVHCSHFFSRIYNTTRWYLDNCLTLCAKCHDHVGKNPHDHTQLVLRELGPMRYQWLLERKNEIKRYRNSDKKEMRQYFKRCLEVLLDMRRNGETGQLTVAAYD